VEIHAPHKPILTVTEALVHLAIVTVGILIALSLEGARQWHEHRSLVAETRENLTREIEENRAELAGYVANVTAMQKQLMHAREIAETVADGKPLNEAAIDLTYHGAELQSASHTTAELTGAFAFMSRDEVVRYARVYDRQSIFQRRQDQVFADFVGAFAGTQLISSGTRKASTRELEDWARALSTAHASAEIAKQVAGALNEEYQRALGAAH
jgi:hypothetical protein